MNPEDRKHIRNLLCTAFEGGANYWYRNLDVEKWPEDKSQIEFWHLDVPLLGGVLVFEDQGEPIYANDNGGMGADDKGVYRLDLDSLQRGLQTFKSKFPRHWADLLKEEDDACTGDVFLQAAIFGEQVYA